jgi:predicted patatin/cPLA2 family phospholipase
MFRTQPFKSKFDRLFLVCLQVVGNISSKALLLDAVAASSYLPFWSGPSAVTSIDGMQAVYDGGFSYPLPCPPGATQ